jgi:cell division protein FtsL
MKRKPGKNSGRKTWPIGAMSLGILLMGIFIGELLVYTWSRVQYTQAGYDISRAVREQQRLLAVQEELKVELARLKSPERLARIAESSMGLKRPTSRQMVVVE